MPGLMRFLRKVGRRGSLTLPVEIREVLEVHDGDVLEFEVVGIVRRRSEAAKGNATVNRVDA